MKVLENWRTLWAPKTRGGYEIVGEICESERTNGQRLCVEYREKNERTVYTVWCSARTGCYYDGPTPTTSAYDLVPIQKPRVMRPWKPSEVPLGNWFRVKGSKIAVFQMISKCDPQVSRQVYVDGSGWLSCERLLESFEHTPDPQADPLVVLPCGEPSE